MPDVTNQQLLKAINVNQELLGGVAQTVETIVDNIVTKKDLDERLKTIPTKDELDERLEAFVTKDDLKALATKADLKATKDDLKLTTIRLERKIDAGSVTNANHYLETRKMIGDLNRRYDTLRDGLAQAAGRV